jgi:5-methylcytosine-specific restriction enzyme subunit McrC
MKISKKRITVFEHQLIKLNQNIDGVVFDTSAFEALKEFYGSKGVPYYSLLNSGVKFNEYVGIIYVSNYTFEILPKTDNYDTSIESKIQWRSLLINMLSCVGVFDIHAPSSTILKLKPNSILDLYIKLFLNEVEYLLHGGLTKMYRKKVSNLSTLKGSIQFGKQVQINLVHQERFYVKHTSYDQEHLIHKILYKALKLIKQINSNSAIQDQLGRLNLNFPDMPEVKITSTLWKNIQYNRKTLRYKNSMEIARLLLMKFHPDLIAGEKSVLALMFDMNTLWEKFVFVSLNKYSKLFLSIKSQSSCDFWKPKNRRSIGIKPDILINYSDASFVVLDTKWKTASNKTASVGDLRQMYVYLDYFKANKVALVYPGKMNTIVSGHFFDPKSQNIGSKECSLIYISPEENMSLWQWQIFISINSFINGNLERNANPTNQLS